MVETELKYPDQIDDVTNRANKLFLSGIQAAKDQGIDITQPVANVLEYDEDED